MASSRDMKGFDIFLKLKKSTIIPIGLIVITYQSSIPLIPKSLVPSRSEPRRLLISIFLPVRI